MMDRSQTGHESPEPGIEAGNPHWARTWMRRLAWTAGGLVLLYFLAAFALSRFLDPTRLADWAEPEIEAALNRDVEIDAVGVKLLPFGVRIEGIGVADPTGLAPELARVELVDLKVALLPLLGRRVRIDRVRVRGVTATLRADASGRSNFADLGAAPDEAGAEAPGDTAAALSLEIRRLTLEDANIEYSSVADSIHLQLMDLTADADVAPGEFGQRAVGRAEAQVIFAEDAATAGQPVPVAFDFDVEPDAEGDRLTIHSSEILLGEAGVEVAGTVDALQDSVRTLALTARANNLSIAQVLEALPDSMRGQIGSARGTLNLDLRIEGPLGPEQTPEVLGSADISGLGLESTDGVLLVDGVSGNVQVERGGIVRPALSGSVLGGDLNLSGVVSVADSGRFDVQVTGGANLANVMAAGFKSPMSLAGLARLDVRASGPTADVQRVALSGTVDVEDLVLDHPAMAPSVRVDSGRLGLHGDSASLRDVRVAVGEDALNVTAVMRDLGRILEAGVVPAVDASVRGSRLDLVKLSAEPPADTALTYGRLAFARLGNRSLGGRTVEELAREMGLARPESLPVAGQLRLQLDTLIDRRGRSEAVQATVDFGPGYVRVPTSELHRFGGTLATRMDVALGADPDQPFSLYLDAENVDAAQFLGATTPLGHVIRGTVTLKIDLAGALDALLLPGQHSLVGTGSIHLRNGGLASNPVTERITEFLGWEALRQPVIQDWQARFIVDEGTFVFEEGTLTGAPGKPRVSGRLGPDGLVDMLAAFALPTERLGAAALRRIGVPEAMTAELMKQEGLVQALLKISGSLTNPVISADPDASPTAALAEAAREAAREKVREEVEERRDDLEERATGLLRGFLKRNDPRRSATDTTAADTAAARAARDTVRRPDTTAAADTATPPDTVAPADTVTPPDTVAPADTAAAPDTTGAAGSR